MYRKWCSSRDKPHLYLKRFLTVLSRTKRLIYTGKTRNTCCWRATGRYFTKQTVRWTVLLHCGRTLRMRSKNRSRPKWIWWMKMDFTRFAVNRVNNITSIGATYRTTARLRCTIQSSRKGQSTFSWLSNSHRQTAWGLGDVTAIIKEKLTRLTKQAVPISNNQ